MIERDDNIPPLAELIDELARVRRVADENATVDAQRRTTAAEEIAA